MEDAVLIHDNVAGNACFAVFDGHGGEQATLLAKQFLPEQLEHHLQQDCSKEEAAHQAFAAVDELMQTKLADEAKLFASGTSSGTVACIALLKAEELILLNLGDCRAVLRETKSAEGAAKAVLEAAGKATKADNAAVIVVGLNVPEPLPKRDPGQNRFRLSSNTESSL